MSYDFSLSFINSQTSTLNSQFLIFNSQFKKMSELPPKPNVWVNILKFAITVLSAIAAALGVQACS